MEAVCKGKTPAQFCLRFLFQEQLKFAHFQFFFWHGQQFLWSICFKHTCNIDLLLGQIPAEFQKDSWGVTITNKTLAVGAYSCFVLESIWMKLRKCRANPQIVPVCLSDSSELSITASLARCPPPHHCLPEIFHIWKKMLQAARPAQVQAVPEAAQFAPSGCCEHATPLL